MCCVDLCLKQKYDITEFLPDTAMFLMRKLAIRGYGVKILRSVNQPNINKPEFDLAIIELKYLRKLFRRFTVIKI